MSWIDEVKHGLRWTSVQVILKTGSQFLVLVVLSRNVNPVDFGIGTVAVSIFYICWPMLEIGLESLIIQMPDFEEATTYLSASWSVALLFGFIGVSLLGTAGFLLPDLMSIPDLRYILLGFCCIVVIRSAAVVNLGWLQRKMKFKELMIIECVAVMIGLVGGTLCLLEYVEPVWAYPGGIMGYYLISSILLLLSSRDTITQPRLAGVLPLIRSSAGFGVPNAINVFGREADKLVVQSMLGLSAVGVHGRAVQLYQIPASLIGQIASRVFFPVLSKHQSSNNSTKSAIERAENFLAVLLIPTSLFVGLNSESIVRVILGEGWQSVVVPLQVLSIGVYFRTNSKFYDIVLQAQGLKRLLIVHFTVNLLITISLVTIGIWARGLNGAVLAIVCASFILNLQLICEVKKVAGIAWKKTLAAVIRGLLLAFTFFLLHVLFVPTIKTMGPLLNSLIELACSLLLLLLTLALSYLLVISPNENANSV